MGSLKICNCTTHEHLNLNLNLNLIISLLLLMNLSSTRFISMAEGRAVFKLMKTPQIVGGEDEKAIMRTQIGSSPPRCERRCNNCGHCEAVQVPATPQDKNKIIHFSTVSLRGEYSSNYKPMSWKCKCGDFIFNP